MKAQSPVPWRLLVAVAALALLVAAGACAREEAEPTASPTPTTGGQVLPEDPSKTGKPRVTLVDTQFESGWINNAIMEYIIENGYGYPVETVEMTTPIAEVSLARGDADIWAELWQQNWLENYNEAIQAGTIKNMGDIYEGGPQFWLVPKWFAEEYDIQTIEDMKRPEVVKALEDPEEPSKGVFVNCPIGWECQAINRAKFRAYGLDEFYNIQEGGSQAALDSALVGAQKKDEPVFGYYWAPTYIMGLYEWHILEEPEYTDACWEEVTKGQEDIEYTPGQACAYETLPVDIGIHSQFEDEAPEIAELLRNMTVGLDPLNETAAWSRQNQIEGEWQKAAIHYLSTYRDRWHGWMPEERFQKVEAALQRDAG